MRKISRLTVLAGLILAFGVVQAVGVQNAGDARTAPLDVPVPVSPELTLGQLPNGFSYFIRENQEPENRVELRLVVNAGSILEDEDQLGLAHFLEHMAFNGTEHFEKQELVGFLESIGMRLGPGVNASTSFDQTIYQIELPTGNPDYMETAFQILEDWAHGLTLDPEEIDKERGVVIEEWRLGQGASSRIRDQQFPVLFSGSRYAERLPIGTLENLQTFEDEALRRFYEDWYRPDLMAVVVVGDVETAEIQALVERHFAGMEGPENPRERVVYPVPEHADTLYSIVTDPELGSTSVSVYHMMEPNSDWSHGGYRQRIVERLYNGMLNDRFSELAREPNAPFIAARSSQGQLVRSSGAYALDASVLEPDVARGLEALFTEAERVARFGFTDSELAREKASGLRGMESQYANRANRSSSAFASEYIRVWLEGESAPGIEYEWELYQRFVPDITLDEVNRVGQDWINGRSRVVLVTAPEKSGAVLPDSGTLAAVLETTERAELTPWVDSVTDQVLLSPDAVPEGSPVVETRTRDGGITEWELANGIMVVLKPTDFDEDQIVFRGFSPGGASLVSDEDFVPASTAAQLIAQGGVGEFDATDLQKVMAGKIANVGPYISEFDEGVSGSASVGDLETLFELVYLRLTAPRADDAFYEIWRTQAAQALANRDLSPATAFNDTYIRLMTGDHPRGRPMTLETLDETDLYESLEFYRERFRDLGDAVFVFVGDIDFEVMQPLVERYLGGLPADGREETWRDVGMRTPDGVQEETVYKGLEPQSITALTFTGPLDYADQSERTGLRATALILESRLSDLMREELGGTYSIGVSPGTAWRPEEIYRVTIQFGSDPERAEELIETVFAGIAALKQEGPTASELSDAQEALRRQFETDFQQNGTWLGQLVSDYQRGVTPGSSIATFPDSVDALTPEWIRDASRRYFDTEHYVRVTLMPE